MKPQLLIAISLIVSTLATATPVGDICRRLRNSAAFAGFTIVELVAGGNEANVYRAHNLDGDVVALRVPLDENARDAMWPNLLKIRGQGPSVNRFLIGEPMGDHPNIVVMPFMEGTIANNLDTFASITRQRERIPSVLDLWDGIGDGLDILHHPPSADDLVIVFHRDIKPANILINVDKVTGDFQGKIADFGIAALGVPKGDKVEWHTRKGIFSSHGTPGYYLYHRASSSYEVREDVFAYGMTLLAMLTGKEIMDLPNNVTYQTFIPSVGTIKHPRFSVGEMDKTIPKDLALISDHAIWLEFNIRNVRELIGQAQLLRAHDRQEGTSKAEDKFVEFYFKEYLLDALKKRDVATMLYLFRSSVLVDQFIETDQIDRRTKAKILSEVEEVSKPYCDKADKEKYSIPFGHTNKPEAINCVLCEKLKEARTSFESGKSFWSFLPFVH